METKTKELYARVEAMLALVERLQDDLFEVEGPTAAEELVFNDVYYKTELIRHKLRGVLKELKED